MSYGSIFLQFEAANGRISQKFARPSLKKEHLVHERAKGVQYEKQFDVNLTRVDESIPDKASVRESMLAYSRKMRSLQDTRFAEGNCKEDPLFVRAKHIPKYPTKPPKKRRPMSFDELLGRDKDVPERTNGSKTRPVSEKTRPLKDSDLENEIHLPLLSERLKKSNKNVQVSLVSASDLYDIVDFSLKSKGTRNDSLRLLRLEQDLGVSKPSPRQNNGRKDSKSCSTVISEDGYSDCERRTSQGGKPTSLKDKNNKSSNTAGEPPAVLTEEIYRDIVGLSKTDPISTSLRLPSINNDPFKRRPNRAKRMKLVDSGLGDIPEDNIVEIPKYKHQNVKERTRVTSPPPQQTLVHGKSVEAASPLEIIDEDGEKTNITSSNDNNAASNCSSETVDRQGKETWEMSTSEFQPEPYGYEHFRSAIPLFEDGKSTKKVIKDDGDVRIEVTQCPPKHETMTAKLKAQKRFKRLIFLRDGPR